RGLAAAIVVLGGLAAITGLLTIVGQQVATQVEDLSSAVVEGIGRVQGWARTGPMHLSDAQIESWIDRAKDAIQAGGDSQVVNRVAEFGNTLTHVLTGLFIVLFASYFFLYEGERIWTWVVGVFPRDARAHLDSSGRVAWVSLTAFVRGTVLVALVDAVGIGVSALALQVPLALAIGVLVFLGAFVPIIGAFVSGIVAVLVALVTQGPWTALFMLLAVLAVQQIESNLLQPLLMGRLVAVHPLAIILAIGAGITVSGIVGALVAVPTVACLNSVVRHLSGKASPPPSPQLEPG
ncbi:MAG: AI-2E family transporter, partial [Nocardioidaceae bacterium]